MNSHAAGYLVPAFSKIERAKAHINELEREIRTFLSKNPYKVRTDIDANGVKVWCFEVDPIPDALNNIASDAVHNLRVPLDKMLTAFKERQIGGSRHKGINFPVGATKGDFDKALSNQEKKFPVDVIEFLRTIEAYAGGNGDLIFALHDMDIEDKHHPVLKAINLGVQRTTTGGVAAYLGPIHTIGSRRGAHMVRDPVTNGMLQPIEAKRPKFIKGGTPTQNMLMFENEDMEFATTASETILQHDFKPVLNIAFNQIKGLEREPVSSALHQMAQLVEGILLAFEKRFFA